MTQQYQHIEYSMGFTLLSKGAKNRRFIKQILANKAYWDAKLERDLREPLFKHPLLLPPFVKEKR